ncbi:MAG TPA: MopE-related protein [Polyangiaceae bacterium]
MLFVLGGGVALDAACSPSTQSAAGDAGPVCDPDSGDPQAGCVCDPTKPGPTDCYTGPAGTSGKGICKTGKRTCTPEGKYTTCDGQITPQPETCNYADDDCNGLVDDLPELADAAVIARCNSPACDQAGFADAAISCWGPDPGICGAGVKTCKGTATGGQPTGCFEYIHGGVPEVCNGIDDDCNGAVDDGLDQEGDCDMPAQSVWPPDANPFDGGSPTKVLGECIHGQLHCEDGGDKCYPSQPTPEVQNGGYGCDGLDNDCNGVVDDHACSDSIDKQYSQDYCCYDGFSYWCDTAANKGNYVSCVLAN